MLIFSLSNSLHIGSNEQCRHHAKNRPLDVHERQRVDNDEIEENVIIELLFLGNRKFRCLRIVEAKNREDRVYQQIRNAHVGRFPESVLESEIEYEDKRG